MELINQEKELLSKEVSSLRATLSVRDEENLKLKEKLKNTEQIVTELTQSLNKMMTENYRRTNSSTLLSKERSKEKSKDNSKDYSPPPNGARLAYDPPNLSSF